MPVGYIPDPELFEMIRRVVRQYSNSFQPRPKGPKRVRRFPSGSGSGSTIRRARALEDIDAASDNETPASGDLEYCDDDDGSLTGDTATATNFAPVAYVEDALLYVDTGKSPPEIINGTCGAFVWVEA